MHMRNRGFAGGFHDLKHVLGSSGINRPCTRQTLLFCKQRLAKMNSRIADISYLLGYPVLFTGLFERNWLNAT